MHDMDSIQINNGFIDDNKVVWRLDPNSPKGTWITTYDEEEKCSYWIDDQSYGRRKEERHQTATKYEEIDRVTDDSGDFIKKELAKFRMHLSFRVNHTEQEEFSNFLYNSKRDKSKFNDSPNIEQIDNQTWHTYEYTGCYKIAQILSQIKEQYPNVVDYTSLETFHNIAKNLSSPKIEKFFIDAEGINWHLDPNSPNGEWLYTYDAENNCYWIDDQNCVRCYDEKAKSYQNFSYLSDAQGDYLKQNRENFSMYLSFEVDHTEQRKFSKHLYYSGGYRSFDFKKDNPDSRQYVYTDSYNIDRILSLIKIKFPDYYNSANLEKFHKIAEENKNIILAKQKRAPESVEIDLKNYENEIKESRKERFTIFKIIRDGKTRYVKLDNRRHGPNIDSAETQAIAAEFFRRFHHAPKSRIVYAKGTNEIIGVETDAVPGISLDKYFEDAYDKYPGWKSCRFGCGEIPNYNIQYPKEIINQLVEAGLNEGYAVGLVAKEIDAHWGNFIIYSNPETKELIIFRIDFDLTFADHMFSLQYNPKYETSYKDARGCDVSVGYQLNEEFLDSKFSKLNNQTLNRPYRWMTAHAFGVGTNQGNYNSDHPNLAKTIEANPESKFRRYKVYLDMILASEEDISAIVTPFTTDQTLQQTKIAEIKNRIGEVKQAMLNSPDFKDFLQSEKSEIVIKKILEEKLDYYLDPLESISYTQNDLRNKINFICEGYQSLTNKIVPEDFIENLFQTKVHFTDKQSESFSISSDDESHDAISSAETSLEFHSFEEPQLDPQSYATLHGKNTNIMFSTPAPKETPVASQLDNVNLSPQYGH